ncbi:MAG: PEGA domain-containing protein [Longimicrobiaceae bacterium]
MSRFGVVALVALTGCATIMHGSKQNVAFSSTPSGAQISVDNQNMGVTPASVPLTRKDKHTVRLTLAGYQPYELQLERKTSGWVWGNLLFGGIPGLAVDAITGSMYKLSPEEVNATLAQGGTAMRTGDTLIVRVVLSADPSWQKIGQLTPSAGF